MIGRAAALTNLGDKDRAFRAKNKRSDRFFRFSPCRCTLMRRKLRQRQIPSLAGGWFVYVGKRISPAVVSPGNTTAWGRRKKASLVTRVASRAHPLAGCRGAATEAARSAGKGRFGGNVETRISPAVTSPGNTTAWGRRKKPPFVKGRFGGNVETRISPAVTSPGNTTAWGRRRNPTARGSCSPRSGGKAP